MPLRDMPIQRKLRRVILQTSGAVLLLTCSAYFVYEFITFRQTAISELSTLGKIVAGNSTAALVFDTPEDASEILGALKAEPHIKAAALYNAQGKLFAYYPHELSLTDFPATSGTDGYSISNSYIIGFQTIMFKDKNLGSLYLRSDMDAMYERLKLYSIIALSVIAVAFLMAYLLSKRLQRVISDPVLALTETARVVSEQRDYSVRAERLGRDEIGTLTDAFNHMLRQIEEQNTQIQLFNQQLEQSIQDRTIELEATNKELEAFSYSVSHDLRAPLRSIDGYSRVMLEDYGDKLDDEAKRLLNIIVRNAVRMGHLIDDLLAFSRIGKQNLTKVKLNMDSITAAVTDEQKAQQGKAQINIKPMLEVEGDSSMLKQVLTNLISNALKYSNKKERPEIEIGSYRENGNNVYYVKDNGAGFDMQYYDKLFGVFQRLHSGNEFEGTGVGLALVHRIVTKHGGMVWAEGKVDKGATFYFSLPVSTENQSQPKQKKNAKLHS
jgi:signal transduction histidine kinase